MTRRLAASGAVELIVIDSAAGLVPQLEMETKLGDAGAGLQARVLASELRRLSRTIARTRASVVFLNQTRAAIGSGETSAGGPPLKLYAAVRIALSASGRRVHFRITKNRVAAAYASGQLEWRTDAGFIALPDRA
jgi:recombination protein RecA